MKDEVDGPSAYLAKAASGFENDMQGVRTGLVAALHGGRKELFAFKRLLPGLTREVLRGTGLADALTRAMALEFFATIKAADDALRAADFVRLDETPVVTDALAEFRQRTVFETDLGSAELRGFSAELRNRSLFSARTTNAEYLNEVQAVVDDILSGKENMVRGRLRLMRKLAQLGYDPMVGFPDDMATVPPAERGSLQDLSSQRRIDLVLETNVRMARGYAQQVAGNRDYSRYAEPAWELFRLYTREIPRGSEESKSAGWEQRWRDAGDVVNFEGASQERLVARKDSPIWQALGDGVGGYTDTLLNPFPPFAFRSGFAWKAVPREKAIRLGLVAAEETPAAQAATLTPGQAEVQRVFKGLSTEMQDALRKELGL